MKFTANTKTIKTVKCFAEIQLLSSSSLSSLICLTLCFVKIARAETSANEYSHLLNNE